MDNSCQIDEVVAYIEEDLVQSQDHPQHLVAFLEAVPRVGVVVVACAPSVDFASASDFWAFGLDGRIGMLRLHYI